MQNNIKIRNLYIGKVQKQINKLMYSVNLLNNLNNVIDNQYGGSNLSQNVDNGLLKGKILFAQGSVQHTPVRFTSLSGVEDKTVSDLKATIEILKNFIKELNNKLLNASDKTEQDTLKKQVEELNTKLEATQKELETKQKELETKEQELANINAKMTEFEQKLNEYNEILEKLRTLVPQVHITDIPNYNKIIDALIHKLKVPQIDTTNLPQQIKTKFENVFDEDMRNKINLLREKAQQLKITDKQTVLITPTSGTSFNFEIPLGPHPAKDQYEADAIKQFVTKKNEEYTQFITDNKDTIEKIDQFLFHYSRINNIMDTQKLTGELHQNFDTFNEYFKITKEDLKQ